MECQCCCDRFDNLNICDNDHYICNTCRELTNVDCIYCDPFNENIENIENIRILSRRHYLYTRCRQNSFRDYLKGVLFILFVILYVLYISKILIRLLVAIDATNYPYKVNWTSFSIYEIILNIGVTSLVIVCCKACCYCI